MSDRMQGKRPLMRSDDCASLVRQAYEVMSGIDGTLSIVGRYERKS